MNERRQYPQLSKRQSNLGSKSVSSSCVPVRISEEINKGRVPQYVTVLPAPIQGAGSSISGVESLLTKFTSKDVMQIQNPNKTTWSKSREEDGIIDKNKSGDESIEIDQYVDGAYENERRSDWNIDKQIVILKEIVNQGQREVVKLMSTREGIAKQIQDSMITQ